MLITLAKQNYHYWATRYVSCRITCYLLQMFKLSCCQNTVYFVSLLSHCHTPLSHTIVSPSHKQISLFIVQTAVLLGKLMHGLARCAWLKVAKTPPLSATGRQNQQNIKTFLFSALCIFYDKYSSKLIHVKTYLFNFFLGFVLVAMVMVIF